MNQPSISARQVSALQELSEMLRASNIAFVAIGGLAAIAWGSKRPLVDIDIQVGKHDMKKARSLFLESLVTDIRHYVSEHWDIHQMVIHLHGVDIDICQADDFFIKVNGKKTRLPNTIKAAVGRQVDSVLIPVIPKDELISYKRKLARPVDLEDIAFLAT